MVRKFIFFISMVTCVLSGNDHKIALIFGITGQDGSYLAELLLEKGYEVHGVKRRASTVQNTQRIDHLYQERQDKYPEYRFLLHYGDITDFSNVIDLINRIKPDEIYNLAAQSHVLISFQLPEYTADVDALGTLRILEAIRILQLKNTKFYQASSSEMFGIVQEVPQTENTPFYPRSPYGVSKVFSFWITKLYREAYGIFACNGILFNHESPRRGENFLPRKVARAAVRIKNGLQDILYVGNVNAQRDWGHARDYVEAMWLMMQHEHADDWVIATGEMHSVRECIETAFKEVGIEIGWQGTGLDEIGYDTKTKKIIIRIDPHYFRPSEVDQLLGDASKAKRLLGWQPKVTFSKLIQEMVESESLTNAHSN
jgi:GDPmannose 4,6-dehydratase